MRDMELKYRKASHASKIGQLLSLSRVLIRHSLLESVQSCFDMCMAVDDYRESNSNSN
jgi:hypothetical protein